MSDELVRTADLRKMIGQRVNQIGWDKLTAFSGSSKIMLNAMIDGEADIPKRVISYLGYDPVPYYRKKDSP